MKYTTIVVPRSSSVTAGATYEADVYLATSPIQQKMEMQVDGKAIPMGVDDSGVMRGKVSFRASAEKYDGRGSARKQFVAEIKMGDSTYRNVVWYSVLKAK